LRRGHANLLCIVPIINNDTQGCPWGQSAQAISKVYKPMLFFPCFFNPSMNVH
jgi:hypothetical protein